MVTFHHWLKFRHHREHCSLFCLERNVSSMFVSCSCSVRLHGSGFLLQIYSSKKWRTVCSHGWTEQQGRASCRQMGYGRWDAPACRWMMALTDCFLLYSDMWRVCWNEVLWFDRGTYFQSGQQKTASNDGFLMVTDFRPEVSILQQLVLRFVNWSRWISSSQSE